MPGRLGMRHFLLGALLLGLIVLVWLAMVQMDRVWRRLDALETRIASAPPTAPGGKPMPPVVSGGAPRQDNVSWARPNVPVTNPRPRTVVSDPRTDSDFRPGGTITEALEGPVSRITPYLFTDAINKRVIDCVCEKLADYNPQTLELEGVLAQQWQMDPGGMWLRVRLRDGVEFSTGEKVTGQDVAFTVGLLKNARIDAARFRDTAAAISKVEVLSPTCVEFTFSERIYSNLDDALRLWVLPRTAYAPLADKPDAFNASTGVLVGSGPYMLKDFALDRQWTPGSGTPIELVRNPRYRGMGGDPQHIPPIDVLRFVSIPDAAARLAAFENWKVNIMRPTPEQALKYQEVVSPGNAERLLSWFNMQSPYSAIWWNCGKRAGKPTPFSDARVRRAMTQMLDRERIIRDFLSGQGRVISSTFRPEGSQADPDVRPWPYDPPAAADLLDAAGWKRPDQTSDAPRVNARGEPFRFELVYPMGQATWERVATYVRDQCATYGIEAVLRPVDPAAMNDVRTRRDFDGLIQSSSPSAPETDPYQYFHSDNIANGGDNWCQWFDAACDMHIVQARTTIDPVRRAGAWHSAHQRIHEQEPCTFLFESPWLRLVSGLNNVRTYPGGVDRFEWWVGERTTHEQGR